MKIATKPWAQVQAEHEAARRNRASENAKDARARLGAAVRHSPDDDELLDRLRAELTAFRAQSGRAS